MIISVGYRVKSKRGIQFRQWATGVLKQYLINGYSINEPRIRQIESAIDELVSSQKILKTDVSRIENLLVKLIEKPILIHNQISLGNKDLEIKILSLIDQIIKDLKDDKEVKAQLKNAKKDISISQKNSRTKNRLMNFFKEIGDDKSDIHETIKTAGIAKSIVTELVKLGGKLREFL